MTTVAVIVSASPALAIDNGVPDGTNHPNAGLLAIEHHGVLDELAARGGLRPATVFDNVGYGIVPTFKGGPVQFEPTSGRMFATSKFVGLTKTHMHLLTNSDAGYGGACYGDSGSPVLQHGSNTAVELVSGGGDRVCRAMNHPLRLDMPTARAFYGDYLQLP